MDFWISEWISGFHSGFLDFWISVWISADGVRDFFRDGPLDHRRVSMRVQRKNYPVSTRTVGVKVNADNTEIYVFP